MDWLNANRRSGGSDTHDKTSRKVQARAIKLEEPGLFTVTTIFNFVCDQSSGLCDEYLRYAERFIRNFRTNLPALNEGVESLDFVRECVRHSFHISQLVPWGTKGVKQRWITDEQIEQIAKSLVNEGFIIPADLERVIDQARAKENS